MTDKQNNKKITALSSKAEEIAALKKFRDSIADDTYLGQLLSDDLIKWFERKVQNDMGSDVYEELLFYENQSTDLQSALRRVGNEIDDLKKKNESLSSQVIQKAQTIGELTDERNRWEDQCAKSESEVTMLTQALDDLKSDYTAKVGEARALESAVKVLMDTSVENQLNRGTMLVVLKNLVYPEARL